MDAGMDQAELGEFPEKTCLKPGPVEKAFEFKPASSDRMGMD